MNNKLLVACFLLFHSAFLYASSDDYKKNILLFYDFIFEVNANSQKAFSEVLGHSIPIIEEHLIFKNCGEDNTSELECFEKLCNPNAPGYERCPSVILEKLIDMKEVLTGGHSLIEIKEKIGDSKVIDCGSSSSVYLNLTFSDGSILFFSVNKSLNEVPTITIFLPSGENVISYILERENRHLIKFVGVIDDPDDYTNVRESPDIQSPIVEQIFNDQLFFFWPTNETNWWRIKSLETCAEGYMHKTRIKWFDISPLVSNELKELSREAYLPDFQCTK